MPAMDSVSLGLWIGAGGRHEEERQNGISHLLEHLLFKGTARRTARQISEAIESVGGSLNGFTSEEYTCYMAKVLHRDIRRAADVLFDMYLHAALKPEEIAREKAVIREEIHMYLDMPQHHVSDLYNEVLLSLIHISEPTRLLSISYAVFCLKKKKKKNNNTTPHPSVQSLPPTQ